ncbi:Mediator of RNA polymerase II transcription subunit [Lachnellula subtilissima]|uniref:Mediator of RNA polymerase II transcription subunit 17 n=1 Tax=Lachnellula subtilissima TaxID=602034 RepID=A0A8H8RG36_9HELO|nr:Mediator of RNA polymerase II transcription subunit [Lachnellula subtilissima]
MASIPNEFPISLKSWPSSNSNDPTSLPTLIQRINFERGGFRDISEESLRQEIAESEAEGSNGEDDGSSEEEEGDEEADRMKELMTARDEMLVQLEAAHHGAAFALDFVSLLLSKDTPIQAGLSMTPQLREMVGTGTLGADKIHASRVTDTQKENNRRVAKGWKIQNLNKTVDTILESATRLEKEMETETKYWEQVLAVSENGWAVCRLPNEKHTLGVRFGFLEAAPAFRNQSLAALRRNPDGSISLDQGVTSTEPQCVRVRIQVNGINTGSSTIPRLVPGDGPIESLILQARNTIFSTELWQELSRESRTLGAFNVRYKGDPLTFPLDSERTILLDPVILGDSAPSPPGPDDSTAEGIAIALNLLLAKPSSKDTNPSPNLGRKAPKSTLQLVTFLDYTAPPPTNHYISPQSPRASLRDAEICIVNPNTIIYHNPLPSQPPPFANFSLAERTIFSLTERLESIATLKLTPDTTLTITSRTSQFPVAGTSFGLSLNQESELNATCVAPPAIADVKGVEDYVFFATSCALASLFISPDGDDSSWIRTAQPNVLRKLFQGGQAKQLVFNVSRMKTGTKGVKGNCSLSVAWEWMRRDNWSVGSENAMKHREANEFGEKREEQGVYEWKHVAGWDDGEGQVMEGLEGVVTDAGREEADGARLRQKSGRVQAFKGN